MSAFLKKINITCLESTELVEKQACFGLKIDERLKLLLHEKQCPACRNYHRQSRWMDEVLSSVISKPIDNQGISPLPAPIGLKELIIKRINSL